VSRYGFDDDDVDRYDDALPLNATCAECGTDYAAACDGAGGLCDPCSDAHDAHTSALEVRLAMLPAGLPVVGRRIA